MNLFLIWLTLLISSSLIFLDLTGAIKNWPKISIVSFISSGSILIWFHSPLSGVQYYLANIFTIAPLILLLVHVASIDPKPNWSYRAMCWILILQLMIYGIHVLCDLEFTYYDEASLLSTILEIAILIFGGHDVKRILLSKINLHCSSSVGCSKWVTNSIKKGD